MSVGCPSSSPTVIEMSTREISPGIVLRMLVGTEVWTSPGDHHLGLGEPDQAFRVERIATISGVRLEDAISALETFPDVFRPTNDAERWQIVDRKRLVELERSWGRVYGNSTLIDVPSARDEEGPAARQRYRELRSADPYLFGTTIEVEGPGREYTGVKDAAFVKAAQDWVSRGIGSVAEVLAKVPSPPSVSTPGLDVS
jgi:hypothetical protein